MLLTISYHLFLSFMFLPNPPYLHFLDLQQMFVVSLSWITFVFSFPLIHIPIPTFFRVFIIFLSFFPRYLINQFFFLLLLENWQVGIKSNTLSKQSFTKIFLDDRKSVPLVFTGPSRYRSRLFYFPTESGPVRGRRLNYY